MKQLLAVTVLALAASACGGDDPDATPDANTYVDPPAFEAACTIVPQTGATDFSTAADFGPITPGTLAGWDANGRWFLTGTRVGGVSSFHFAVTGASVVVDRDTENPGTLDDDALFQRTTFSDGQTTFIIAKRVIDRNRTTDTLRADRAVCDGESCRVCTAKLERATYNGNEGLSDKLPLVGELFNPSWETDAYTFNVRVVGTLAYLIRQDGLYIIETADPAHPVELGHYRRTGDGYSNDVKIVDAGAKRFAIIADSPVDVVDVTNPASPFLISTITEEAHTLFTETIGAVTLAYFGNYDATCAVWDVTNPALPKRLGKFQSEGELVHDLSVKDGIAYLNSWDAGLQVVDFTTPAQPTLLGTWADTPTGTSHSNWTTTIAGKHVAVHGEESYGAHMNIVDLDTMQPIGTYKTRDHVSIHNIMAFGSKAYFTHYQDGVRVLDLADPTQPVLVGYHNTWDAQADYTSNQFFEGAVGLDVDLARKLVFVADSPRGLLILRDETP
ncbi:MAG: hypothetical protein ABI867_08290 [Kofleriaceae bacterium]